MKTFFQRSALLLASSFATMLASSVWASGGGNEPIDGINYIPVTPPLIVNYGGPGKVRFIKAEISLRTENAEDAKEVMHHLPLIRDRLISILSAQTEESIGAPEGKEHLRLYALAEINKALHKIEMGDEAEAPPPEKDDAPAGKHAQEKHRKKKKAEKHEDDADEKAAAEPSHASPASDLFFNNFVVQK